MKTKNPTSSRFKDEKGRWLTMSLFYETYSNLDTRANYPPLYTIKDEDYNGLLSIRKKYLELRDPSEYKIATQYFGGWEHWKVLNTNKWLSNHVNSWREELEVIIRCGALEKMQELATSDKAIAKDALKFMINREWEVRRGRPSKDEKERQLRIESDINAQVDSDFKLLNLNER